VILLAAEEEAVAVRTTVDRKAAAVEDDVMENEASIMVASALFRERWWNFIVWRVVEYCDGSDCYDGGG